MGGIPHAQADFTNAGTGILMDGNYSDKSRISHVVENVAGESTLDLGMLLAALYGNMGRMEKLRGRKDGMVSRLTMGDGRTVIVKLWVRPGLRGALRWMTGTASAIREWRTLRRLHAMGVGVPRAFGCCRLSREALPYTDALFMEDMGVCETAFDRLKRLIAEGNENLIAGFEDALIELTTTVLRAGIVDPDHSLVNTIVVMQDRLVRLDFEIAQRILWRPMVPSLYGRMLGRLMLSYVFAVQPDTARAKDFARRLTERLRPPQAALRAGRRFLDHNLDWQRRHCGIDTTVNLPW